MHTTLVVGKVFELRGGDRYFKPEAFFLEIGSQEKGLARRLGVPTASVVVFAV